MRSGELEQVVRTPVVAGVDVLAKVALLAFLGLELMDPGWGNLDGKAPVLRALTYPSLAFVVPVWWALRRPLAVPVAA